MRIGTMTKNENHQQILKKNERLPHKKKKKKQINKTQKNAKITIGILILKPEQKSLKFSTRTKTNCESKTIKTI